MYVCICASVDERGTRGVVGGSGKHMFWNPAGLPEASVLKKPVNTETHFHPADKAAKPWEE